jgi:D-alanyl-lipoteichoic acid acyltransferase DltB (MBOAT superfamily)
MAITFFLVLIGWVIFRAETIGQAYAYLSKMLTMSIFSVERFDGLRAFGFALIILFIEWLQRDKQHALEFPKRRQFNYRFVRWSSYFVVIMMIVLYSGGDQTFIYFQF